MKIVTLTLNPAIDVHCSVEKFTPCHENLAFLDRREAGGKGVNISRALLSFGISSKTVVALGRENADGFLDEIRGQGLDVIPLYRPGRIRENLTIHPKDAPETRLSFTGFSADESLLADAERAISPFLEEGDVLTVTGRMPDGLPMSAIQEFLRRQKEKGILLVIDSRSFSLADLLAAKPFLIKPNEEEILSYMRDLGDDPSAKPDTGRLIDAAEAIGEHGIPCVMVSLGGSGAFLVYRGSTYFFPAPKLSPLSTIGAGDSSIAGFLSALTLGKEPSEALRYAVAFGSAACLTPGTLPPRKEDILRFLG